ncbi:MAG TPA: hypothetical protein VFH74_03525 [Gaiellales bacterium]|nr:hypothetical protein [Gaiellales bacterium]
MSPAGPSTLNGSTRLEVAICDSREFDRHALAAALSNDPRLHVAATTGDPAQLLLELSRLATGELAVILGSRVLREHATLPGLVRSAHPGARVVAIGVDESALRRLVDACRLDGYVRRNGEIDDISSVVRGADV